MKQYKDSEQVTIKIRRSSHEKLKEIRNTKGISITFAVDEALEDYLKKIGKEK